MSSPPIASGSRPRPVSTPHRHPIPKSQEVWDEDFEFPTLALPKSKKVETPRRPRSDAASPVEGWGEEYWDESPPGPSRLPIANLGKRKSPTQPDLARLSLSSPPRTSQSTSTSSDIHLPRSPTSPKLTDVSASSSALQLVSGQPGPSTSSSNQRSRSGSTSAAVRNKLIKRHPSTSFIPINSSSSVDVSFSSPPLPGARSSYDLSRPPPPPLPRSKSGEQMPPPPLSTRPRSKSKSKVRPISRQGEIRVSAIPLSPSSDSNVDPPRRPSFWKRLSGQPLMGESGAGAGSYAQDSIKIQHKRSASLGRRNVREMEERPPVPPIPANLRSPSATSTASNTSVSSSNRSGPSSSISAIIRRTASGLSRKSNKEKDPAPPSSFPYATSNQNSTASVNSVPPTPLLPQGAAAPQRSPALPTSHSFSRGYHLPSPSPQSPYRPALGSTVAPASLPHSMSFPLRMVNSSDSGTDTETEPEGDAQQQTPRRKKIRPVSALPAPRMGISRGWNAEGWRGFSDQGPSGSKLHDVSGKRSTSAETPPPQTASPRTANFAMSTANTIRRIGSISKKHGRRLSGGFKFGGNTLPVDTEATPSRILEPVVGSPSKPGHREEETSEEADESRDEADESFDQAREMRDGSASAPTSLFRNTSTGPGMTSSASEATIMGNPKNDKERRRQSWNDFVIPKSIMDMQSGLNKNRSAIKQFDAGIKRLEVLLDERDQARQNVEASTSEQTTIAFEKLNYEFREEWAIAAVLVRVGNTGRSEGGGARVSSDSADHSSPRTRRITMTSSDAAGDILRSASDGTPPISTSAFHSSTPANSSSSPMSPSRGLSDRWRASTGRHDLTPRELELLRNIMNTPVSQRPSSSARQASTISSSSGIRASDSSRTIVASATLRQISKSAASDRSVSRVRLPSPSDSPFIIPSGSFPSPNTASALANPGLNKRGQKTGFAGFKDFLRTMSIKSSVPSSPSARRLNFMSSPTSPQFPVKSPMLDGSPQPSIESIMPSPPVPGLTDRQKKRTSVRNIFRSSSGDWSGLVNKEKENEKGKEKQPEATPPISRQPSQPDLSFKPRSKQSSPRRRISFRRGPKEPSTPSEASSDQSPLDDRTVRPNRDQARKSRIIGLGWPELEDGLPPSGLTPPRPGPMRRSTTSDKDTVIPAGPGHLKEGTAYSTWSDFPDQTQANVGDDQGREQKVRAASAQSDEITVVLTPENLPRMLEYVQDCEKTLGRWRTKAEVFLKVY